MGVTYNKSSEVVKVVESWDVLWGKFRNEFSLNPSREDKPIRSYKNKYKSTGVTK